MKKLSTKRREEAEVVFEIARLAQTEYLSTLRQLEACLEIEVDGTADLRDTTFEYLLQASK